MLRLAHRGDWRRAPENTLEAVAAACELPGVDGVEFDVRVSSDRVPVIIHDENLRRVQGVDRMVADLTAAELRTCGVPALSDVLAAVPADAFLDVELKEYRALAAVDVLRRARGDTPARAVISSFQPRILESLARLMPGWPRWLNVEFLDERAIGQAEGVGCQAVAVELHSIKPETASRVREESLGLVAWPVRRRATLRRLERLNLLAACVEGAALG